MTTQTSKRARGLNWLRRFVMLFGLPDVKGGRAAPCGETTYHYERPLSHPYPVYTFQNGAIVSKCTKGEATVATNTINGKPFVCVGILGTRKIVAICGEAGVADEDESTANAVRIATDWNRHNK